MIWSDLWSDFGNFLRIDLILIEIGFTIDLDNTAYGYTEGFKFP